MTDDETKATRDALIFGTGMMLDGKHVPMEAVMTDDLIAHIWDMAHRLDSEKDRHAIIALSDLVPVLENRIEKLQQYIGVYQDQTNVLLNRVAELEQALLRAAAELDFEDADNTYAIIALDGEKKNDR
jgi:hypothetical protein